MWARAGSHREPVRRQFARNPAYFEGGNRSTPMMVFRNLFEPKSPSGEGSTVEVEVGANGAASQGAAIDPVSVVVVVVLFFQRM